MRPCCLERIHKLFPQYIPSLFPYSTPVFESSSASSNVSKKSSRSAIPTEPSKSSPSIIRRHSILSDSGSSLSKPKRASLPAKPYYQNSNPTQQEKKRNDKPSQHNVHVMEIVEEKTPSKQLSVHSPHRKYNIALVSMSPSPLSSSPSNPSPQPAVRHSISTVKSSTTENTNPRTKEKSVVPMNILRKPTKEEIERHDQGLNELRGLFSLRNK